MDSKQKRKILISVYKSFALFALLSIGWIIYFSINELIKKEGMIWMNITLLSMAVLLFICFIVNLTKIKKIKNMFVLSKFILYLTFITFLGIIAGIFYMYYTAFVLDLGYYLTIGTLILSELFSISMIIVGVQLLKLFKNTTITIDELSQTPNYDDELLMKKQLDELNRKLEMKKVSEQIESLKKELGEN